MWVIKSEKYDEGELIIQLDHLKTFVRFFCSIRITIPVKPLTDKHEVLILVINEYFFGVTIESASPIDISFFGKNRIISSICSFLHWTNHFIIRFLK
jgi:hypothetical protein